MNSHIFAELVDRSVNNKEIKELVVFLEHIKNPIEEHLNLINTFLPEFDSHDIKHSYAVINNMELILGNSVNDLTSLELFLLYAVALFHDCGMALSVQENALLLACEGEEENLSIPQFGLDGKQNKRISEMKNNIKACRDKLYGHLISNEVYVHSSIFDFEDEESLINHLADLAIKYQSFRNGFLPQIKKESNTLNMNQINEIVRKSFIRTNHAYLSRVNCYNLSKKFDMEILGNYGKLLSKVIGELCYSHDVDFKDAISLLEQMPNTYFNNEKADLVFVSAMLRIADVLHFNIDRVSYSLSFEKGTNKNLHWTSKLTGLSFAIVNNEKTININVNAPCEKPEDYYFIKNYIKYVENELSNLAKCKKNFELGITILNKVNDEGLHSISDDFKPADGLCIKMKQSHIIGLLMGKELYKDEFACIRELYQNSLDACRCMQLENPSYIGNIKFGISSDKKHGISRNYLYCLDNGIGMDMHVIQEYLLHIGNTFYSSSEFFQMCSNSQNRFYPVSQFGVGVLSCFMLCDLLEVTTKKENSEYICLTIDGKNEYLYFSTPKQEDKEQIGRSGTMIKLYLQTDCISDSLPSEKILNDIIMYQSVMEKDVLHYNVECDKFLEMDLLEGKGYRNQCNENLINQNKYLITVLTKYIKLIPRNINILIEYRLEKNGKKDFLNLNKYNLINMSTSGIKKKYISEFNGKEYIDKFINVNNIERREIIISSKNLQYRNVLYFPKNYSNDTNYQSLLFCRTFERHKAGYLIDGITVKINENSDFDNKNDSEFSLNFIGEVRPKLSIDRLNILDISNNLQQEWDKLKEIIIKEELKYICDYLNSAPQNRKKELSDTMWNYYFASRRQFFFEIIKCVSKYNYKIIWNELSDNIICNSEIGLSEFLKNESICLKSNINYFMSSNFFKYIVEHRIATSESIYISDEKITVNIKKFKVDKRIFDYDFNYFSYHHMVYRMADYSKTILRQYDFVNSFFSLINNNFFQILAENNKSKTCHDVIIGEKILDNSIDDFYDMDSMSIFNNILYYRMHPNEYQMKYMPYFKILNGTSSRRIISKNKSYLIYVFVSPNLTYEQQEYMKTLKTINQDYYKGALNGWSVLYTEDFQVVSLPGIHDIKEMLVRIPDSYWVNGEKRSYLSNGTEVTFELVKKLREELNYNV